MIVASFGEPSGGGHTLLAYLDQRINSLGLSAQQTTIRPNPDRWLWCVRLSSMRRHEIAPHSHSLADRKGVLIADSLSHPSSSVPR